MRKIATGFAAFASVALMTGAFVPTAAIAQSDDDVPDSFYCSIDLRGSGLSHAEIYAICQEIEAENPSSSGDGRNTYHYFNVPVRHCVGVCDAQDY